MKRLGVILGLLLAMVPATVHADFIDVWENTDNQGQTSRWTSSYGDKPNLENVTTPFAGTGTACNGVYAPFHYANWANCISSFYLSMPSGKCFAAYNKPNYVERLEYWDTRSGSMTRLVISMGADNDKWESIRWGVWSYTAQTCVW